MSEQFDVYDPGERKIYRYFDGKSVVPADPMVLWRKLMEVRGDLSAHMTVAYFPGENKGKAEAFAQIAVLSRKIFGLKPLEEGGLTETECVGLVNHFWRYCESVKKNSTDSDGPSDAI